MSKARRPISASLARRRAGMKARFVQFKPGDVVWTVNLHLGEPDTAVFVRYIWQGSQLLCRLRGPSGRAWLFSAFDVLAGAKLAADEIAERHKDLQAYLAALEVESLDVE